MNVEYPRPAGPNGHLLFPWGNEEPAARSAERPCAWSTRGHLDVTAARSGLRPPQARYAGNVARAQPV